MSSNSQVELVLNTLSQEGITFRQGRKTADPEVVRKIIEDILTPPAQVPVILRGCKIWAETGRPGVIHGVLVETTLHGKWYVKNRNLGEALRAESVDPLGLAFNPGRNLDLPPSEAQLSFLRERKLPVPSTMWEASVVTAGYFALWKIGKKVEPRL